MGTSRRHRNPSGDAHRSIPVLPYSMVVAVALAAVVVTMVVKEEEEEEQVTMLVSTEWGDTHRLLCHSRAWCKWWQRWR